VVGRTVPPLTPEPAGLTADALPAPGGRAAFKLAAAALPQVLDILKGQVVLSATGPDGALTDATSAQLAGGLADLATYPGPFGPSFNQRTPTSRSVNMRLTTACADTAGVGLQQQRRLHVRAGALAVLATGALPRRRRE
jgi:hypothetical protein